MKDEDALDGNGDALPLLNTETNVVDSDEGVLDVGQLKKLDDLVDVGNLLLLQGRKHTASAGEMRSGETDHGTNPRNVGRLSKKGAELQSLSDGLVRLVQVDLGNVTGRPLERFAERSTVDLDASLDDTVILSESENIKEARKADAEGPSVAAFCRRQVA